MSMNIKGVAEMLYLQYSGKENAHLEESIDDRVQDLLDLIGREYISSGTSLRKLDFGRVAQYFTLDVISDLAFRTPFGDLTKNEDVHDYIKTMEENLPTIIVLSNIPSLNNLIKVSGLMNLLAPKVKDKKGLGRVMAVARDVVAQRFGPDKTERDDMLGSFLRHGLNQEDAQSECLIQILAGSDTTATSIRATFLYIITHPQVYAKLKYEIDEAIREQRVSSAIIRDSEAKELPYLQACIKEGLRMWPPVTSLMEKEVPAGGDVLDGRYIPGGTRIGYCAWGLQRRKDVYGENAEIFYPERWLDATEDDLAKMNSVHSLIFGYGRWSCLGKSVALIELDKVFFEYQFHPSKGGILRVRLGRTATDHRRRKST
ncbi:MAG: hypothetical protein M1833_002667 [Piccolia ochrophora]|nr:MAG: hypothetical protein M1833_002667 [Piccolia ochrophora]